MEQHRTHLFCLLISIITLLLGSCTPTSTGKTNVMEIVIPFDTNPNTTPTYHEVISLYEQLAASRPDIVKMTPFGMTDSGYPLHEVVINNTHTKGQKPDKVTLFINNAIHPGEPCGVDASMLMLRDLLSSDQLDQVLETMNLVIIPFYNIGGGLNRGSYSRANQVGPEAYGFRGNARNYDLNRDFIKCDTENAKSFNQLFTKWNPHVFIDTHTSNGADYQYVMTLIATQKDKLAKPLADLLEKDMMPFLYQKMKEGPYEMIPYVNVDDTPDDGIMAFLDLPRYSTGYAALHHTIGFMPETHMLKPYKDRVLSTKLFLETCIAYILENQESLIQAKQKAEAMSSDARSVPVNWEINMEAMDSITFKGYEAGMKPSEVSGLPRRFYDRSKPYTKDIPFWGTYDVKVAATKPKAYVIPQAYKEVIERLQWNGVQMEALVSDTVLEVERYRIASMNSVSHPYEGHYIHYDVEVTVEPLREVQYYKGDWLIQTDQAKWRYIIETLEPQAPDSYFAWNFFDAIMMQKEYFSAYVFEDLAADMLRERPDLREGLSKAVASDPELAKSARGQLDWVYKRSPYYEGTHKLYPIGRIM